MQISSAAATPGLCVLIVEDDEADAYLICRSLWNQTRVGRVVRACDGAEALRMVERGEVTPDLAIIDLRLPVLDGFEVLAALASRDGPGFPMVVLTSSQAPHDGVRSRLRGAARVICKPAAAEDLEMALASVIDWVCRRRATLGYQSEIFKAKFQGIPATKYLIAIEERLETRAAC